MAGPGCRSGDAARVERGVYRANAGPRWRPCGAVAERVLFTCQRAHRNNARTQPLAHQNSSRNQRSRSNKICGSYEPLSAPNRCFPGRNGRIWAKPTGRTPWNGPWARLPIRSRWKGAAAPARVMGKPVNQGHDPNRLTLREGGQVRGGRGVIGRGGWVLGESMRGTTEYLSPRRFTCELAVTALRASGFTEAQVAETVERIKAASLADLNRLMENLHR